MSGKVLSWPHVGDYNPPPRIRKESIHFIATCPRCKGAGRHQSYTSYKHLLQREHGKYPCHCNQCRIRWDQPYAFMRSYGNWWTGAFASFEVFERLEQQ